MTYFVSITRLRVRSLRFMPLFALRTYRTLQQVRQAGGFLGGSLLADRRRAFWTMTVWDSADSMRAYMTTGAHRSAMPHLLDWCDEASVAHWEQADKATPSWAEADARMRREGRPSKLRNPSPSHATLAYAPPRTQTGAPIVPVGRPA